MPESVGSIVARSRKMIRRRSGGEDITNGEIRTLIEDLTEVKKEVDNPYQRQILSNIARIWGTEDGREDR